jgi:4-amino-4-deoxy-L-arabinose transferase-like glycosyltransferase
MSTESRAATSPSSTWTWLAGIALIALLARLYGITSPLLDGYHERQTQTAMVTRNLYRDGMNVFYTRYDFLGDSPGYAVLEFPLHNVITAGLYAMFGVHEVLGRLVTLLFSVASVPFGYALARHFVPHRQALCATAIMALSLTNLYLGRAYMPEAVMMFFAVSGMHFGLQAIETRAGPNACVFWLAGLLIMAACLVKTPAVLLLVPLGFAWLHQRRWRGLPAPGTVAAVVALTVPVLLWNRHAASVTSIYWPEARVDLHWLVARGDDLDLRFSADFYKAMAISMGLLLTPAGCVLCAAGGITALRARGFGVLWVWIGTWVAFIIALAELHSTHYYYQLPMLPPLAILSARGAAWLWRQGQLVWKRRRRAPTVLAAATALGLAGAQSAAYVYYFQEAYDIRQRLPHHMELALLLKERTAPDALVAVYDGWGDTALTYYADRKTWLLPSLPGASGVPNLAQLRARGVTHFITVNSSYARRVPEVMGDRALWDQLTREYALVVRHDHYLVFDLRPTTG